MQNANASDIKKAFRRLSLQLHPDKNPSEDAELKFRNVSDEHSFQNVFSRILICSKNESIVIKIGIELQIFLGQFKHTIKIRLATLLIN